LPPHPEGRYRPTFDSAVNNFVPAGIWKSRSSLTIICTVPVSTSLERASKITADNETTMPVKTATARTIWNTTRSFSYS
jgi:hypothetical protein